jgi:DNA (cytosine-5)-methyltransferase 1
MRVGSLFTGYGGLDMAVGGDLAWYAEVEPAACKVLAAHYPGVPNLGDVTAVDWSAVEPVDVITGGYPCQPFSNAGKRKGKDDDRHLWPYVRDAIGAIRPRWAVLENVRGHLTLGFADVLADLADLGVSARWGVVRAADAGAPHSRARVFIVANTEGTDEPNGVAQARPGTTEPRERGGSDTWGTYASAVTRWESVTGRSAPQPWVGERVSPAFVEWMMGLPEGHVTGHGLSPSAELKMLGNGVVPQQARLALQLLGGVA